MDLKLTDYKDIWTKFCFLDESGSLGNRTDDLFTVGMLKCSQPYFLQSNIIYERSVRKFHDEIKFNKLSKNNIEFAKAMLSHLFSTRSVNFYSYTLNKKGVYLLTHFDRNPWQAYEAITIRVLKAALASNEILVLIADYVCVPRDVKFELCVKRKINEEQKRLSVAGVCRFDSKSNDLLQLTDLLIGAITYDLKLKLGIVCEGDRYKKEFLRHFKDLLGIQERSFMEGFRSHMFNVFVDDDVKKRYIIKEKESSS